MRNLVDGVLPFPIFKPTIVDYKIRVADLQKYNQLNLEKER
ncbi:hypothetical protein CHY_0810 [Carboxydothermus hydrogenoformans Z-2901]|uniref:Uncharacterized protein n=1 Tax=Carboxydothermus hydrogenoformans (strain ATCC BAA-161 / DSM 6008 / Z-2901) TaxID=246194 RepID=Q3ADX0_CARHZ|nr:hypothetical protein CHY_0810 [Carboxydothermus hydrogenoformans Z-2901]